MKLFLKSLKGDKQDVDVDPQDTVESLKARIKELQGHEPSLQKLICAGQIMENSKRLCDYAVKENDSLVLMVSKPKPQSRPENKPVVPERPPQPEESVPVPQPQNQPMNNAERVQRAVEILMGAQEEDPGEEIDALDDYPETLEDQLQLLLADPSMRQLRTDILLDPSILQTIAQQLEQTNPTLAQLIADHPEEIVEYLQQEEDAGEGDFPRSRPAHVEVSTEEMQAIRNLASLGFSEEDALEAYLSCDKDEAMAANLLFDTYTPLAAQPPRSSRH